MRPAAGPGAGAVAPAATLIPAVTPTDSESIPHAVDPPPSQSANTQNAPFARRSAETVSVPSVDGVTSAQTAGPGTAGLEHPWVCVGILGRSSGATSIPVR